MRKIFIYDTTLRDGAQFEGISFTVQDKLRICEKLDSLGIDFIEGGWPGANPKESEFFEVASKQLKLKRSKLVAFGSTRRVDSKVAKDAIVNALLKAGTEYVTIFGKTWDLHVKEVLRTSEKENLKMISDTVSFLSGKGRNVIYDAEHFFDGYENNPVYAVETLKAAFDAGAETLVLCDTNGGTLTGRVYEIVEEVKGKIHAPLGIHTHNDAEMAVANSIAAVEAGCVQVQGTFNGYGERCGNANLVSIVPALRFKLGYDCLSDLALMEFTEASKYIAETANMKHHDSQPYVGSSAFAHKAGVHINAMMKDPRSYEHMDPSKTGNKRRILISELSGRSSIVKKAGEMGIMMDQGSPEAMKILNQVQDMEKEGYQFELAEASLMLLMKRASSFSQTFFSIDDLRVIVEKRFGGNIVSEATVKVRVGDVERHTVSMGDGPVHAMDQALRKSLVDYYPHLKKMHLSDFRVRVLDERSGTAAKVRVLIQSQDEQDSWWTVGVSENIIEASWKAILDSIEYKLLKDMPAGKDKKASKQKNTSGRAR
ncbi:MAG: citramalate synthase [Candidatus Omnitrophica bacterium]|nr:citramalate synthase [Candidatus Omnitrophota bacterium]